MSKKYYIILIDLYRAFHRKNSGDATKPLKDKTINTQKTSAENFFSAEVLLYSDWPQAGEMPAGGIGRRAAGKI
jgi:hypothetical protein